MVRRAGLWVLLGMFLLVAGCTAIVAALVGEAAEDNDRREAEALTQVSCAVTGVTALGDVEVDVTADNTTSKRSDFFVEFELRDGSVTFLGDGFANLTNVPAGERLTKRGFTAVDAPDGGIEGVGCRVIDVDRRAST